MRQPHDATDVSWKGLVLSAVRLQGTLLCSQPCPTNISPSRVIASFASERGAICGGP